MRAGGDGQDAGTEGPVCWWSRGLFAPHGGQAAPSILWRRRNRPGAALGVTSEGGGYRPSIAAARGWPSRLNLAQPQPTRGRTLRPVRG